MMDLKREAIKGVKWTGLTSSVTSVGKLMKIYVLNLYLESTEFGLMAVMTTIIYFLLPLFDLGLSSAIIHRQRINQTEYSSLFWLNAIMGISIYAVLWFLSPWIGELYNEPRIGKLIPLVGIVILLGAFSTQHKTYLVKELKFRLLSLTQNVADLASLGLAVLLVMNEYGVFALIYSVLVRELICSVVFFINGNRLQPIKLIFSWKSLYPFLKIGLPKFGSMVLIQAKKSLDNLIIGYVIGVETLGVYYLAKEFVSKPYEIINPIIMKVGEPILSKTQDDLRRMKRVFMKIMEAVIEVKLPVYVLTFVLAEEFAVFLYSGKMQMVPLVRILCVHMAFFSFLNPNGALYIAKGRTDIELRWNIGASALFIPVIFAAAQFGLESLAFAISAFTMFLFFWTWKYIVGKLCGASFHDLFSVFLRPLLFLLVVGIPAFFLKESVVSSSLPIQSLSVLRVAAVSGIVGVFYVLFLFRYSAVFREFLEGTVAGKLRKIALRLK
ncbi:MAG: MOP flippase family protein [Cytophagales bacterium]|nr:MOP flippase family protein [Cytophagales bacterium]